MLSLLANRYRGVRCSAWVAEPRTRAAREQHERPGAERSGRSESFLKIVLAQAAYAYEAPCMTTTHTLLKKVSLYPVLARFRAMKDIPAGTQGTPLLASFGLWGKWFIVRGPGGLLCADGSEMPCHVARLNDFGPVVGPRDLEAAAGTPMEEAWRESYRSTIAERMGVAA